MRGAIFPLAGVLAAAFLLVIGDSAASQSRLRIGYVALAGTVPSDRDLFGAPLSGCLRATKRFDVQGKVVYVSPNQDPTAAMASLARQRYDLVIVGFAAVDPVDAVAGKFPRVKFLMPGFPIEALRHPRANVQWTW